MRAYLPLILVALTACGPSLEEKQNIAIITCNIMGESLNMDASMRIKEINSARTNINADPFLEGDEAIKEAFKYGLCNELVLDDPEYKNKLSILKEEERIANERAEEEERIRLEKIAEDARILVEQAAERARIALEKEKEEKRIAAEKAKKEKIANTKAYTLEVIKVFEDYPPNPILKRFDMSVSSLGDEQIELIYSCENFSGLNVTLIVDFKNSVGQLKKNNSIGFCSNGTHNATMSNYSFVTDEGWTRDIEDIFYKDNPKDYVESIYLQLEGSVYLQKYEENFKRTSEQRDLIRKMDPKTYGLEYGDEFDVSKVQSRFILYESQN